MMNDVVLEALRDVIRERVKELDEKINTPYQKNSLREELREQKEFLEKFKDAMFKY